MNILTRRRALLGLAATPALALPAAVQAKAEARLTAYAAALRQHGPMTTVIEVRTREGIADDLDRLLTDRS